MPHFAVSEMGLHCLHMSANLVLNGFIEMLSKGISSIKTFILMFCATVKILNIGTCMSEQTV